MIQKPEYVFQSVVMETLTDPSLDPTSLLCESGCSPAAG